MSRLSKFDPGFDRSWVKKPKPTTEAGWFGWTQRQAKSIGPEILAQLTPRIDSGVLRELMDPNSPALRGFADDIRQIVQRKIELRELREKKKAILPFATRFNLTVKPSYDGPKIDIKIIGPQRVTQVSKGALMPGRYFEIHGPGGRVRKTTNTEVMKKAKKQGLHVQMKYKMPTGKAPVTLGFYALNDGVQSGLARYFLNKNSIEFAAAKQHYRVRLQTQIDRVQKWSDHQNDPMVQMMQRIFGK